MGEVTVKVSKLTASIDRTLNHAQDLLTYAVEHGYEGEHMEIQADILHAMFAIEVIKDALSANVVENRNMEE